MSCEPVTVEDFRLVIESPLAGDSRAMVDEIEIVDEVDAKRLGKYFRENPVGGANIHVEKRQRTLWEEV